MDRSDVAADILLVIQACLTDAGACDYVLFRSRGVPPAECNSIAAVWGDSIPIRDEDCPQLQPCDSWREEHDLLIVLTRICMAPDQQDAFDPIAEDTESVCFERDFSVIDLCLKCADWSQLAVDHGINSIEVVKSYRDVETEGGGYSAYIEIRIVSEECCP